MEVERSLRVLDGVVTVLDGVAGVEPQTETVWDQANKFGIPRLVFVNKLDRLGASFDRCIDSLRSQFTEVIIVPLQIPIGLEGEHKGVVDLLEMKSLEISKSVARLSGRCRGTQTGKILQVIAQPEWKAVAVYVESTCQPVSENDPLVRVRTLIAADISSLLTSE